MEGQQQKNSYVQILGNVLTLISLKQAYKIHDKKGTEEPNNIMEQIHMRNTFNPVVPSKLPLKGEENKIESLGGPHDFS